MLKSANFGLSVFLVFYYKFVKRGLSATKLCTHNVTYNVSKCCKFGDSTISTFSCVHILWLNHMSVRTV